MASSESDGEDERESESRKAGKPPPHQQQRNATLTGNRESHEANRPRRRSVALQSPTEAEYDPDVDGEMRTDTVQSSGSNIAAASGGGPLKALPKELYPPE